MGLRLLAVGLLLLASGCAESGYSSSAPATAPAAPVTPTAATATPETPAETVAAASDTTPAATSDPAAAETNKVDEAIEAKKSLPTKDITFDDIKFDIEKDGKFERSMLTPQIEELFGRNIRVRGYILPTFQQSGIRNFVLVRDNMECCFGPGAAIYDCIVVDMVPGATTDYTTRPVTAEGRFSFQELLDFDGVTRAIYHLEATSVK